MNRFLEQFQKMALYAVPILAAGALATGGFFLYQNLRHADSAVDPEVTPFADAVQDTLLWMNTPPSKPDIKKIVGSFGPLPLTTNTPMSEQTISPISTTHPAAISPTNAPINSARAVIPTLPPSNSEPILPGILMTPKPSIKPGNIITAKPYKATAMPSLKPTPKPTTRPIAIITPIPEQSKESIPNSNISPQNQAPIPQSATPPPAVSPPDQVIEYEPQTSENQTEQVITEEIIDPLQVYNAISLHIHYDPAFMQMNLGSCYDSDQIYEEEWDMERYIEYLGFNPCDFIQLPENMLFVGNQTQKMDIMSNSNDLLDDKWDFIYEGNSKYTKISTTGRYWTVEEYLNDPIHEITQIYNNPVIITGTDGNYLCYFIKNHIAYGVEVIGFTGTELKNLLFSLIW